MKKNSENIYVCKEVIKKQYQWGIIRVLKYNEMNYELEIYQDDFAAIVDNMVNCGHKGVVFSDDGGNEVHVEESTINNEIGFIFSVNEIEIFVSRKLFLDE